MIHLKIEVISKRPHSAAGFYILWLISFIILPSPELFNFKQFHWYPPETFACGGNKKKRIHSVCGNMSDLLHEGEHSFSVLLPLVGEVALMRELITAQEHGQLQTVCVQVAEIIHTYKGVNTTLLNTLGWAPKIHTGILPHWPLLTSCDWFPFGPIDDAVPSGGSVSLARALEVVCHGQVCGGVRDSQPPEEGLIRSHAGLVHGLSVVVPVTSSSVVLILLPVAVTLVVTRVLLVGVATVIVVIVAVAAVVATVVAAVVAVVIAVVIAMAAVVAVATVVAVAAVVAMVIVVFVAMLVACASPLLLSLRVSLSSPVLLWLLPVFPSPLWHVKEFIFVPMRNDRTYKSTRPATTAAQRQDCSYCLFLRLWLFWLCGWFRRKLS